MEHTDAGEHDLDIEAHRAARRHRGQDHAANAPIADLGNRATGALLAGGATVDRRGRSQGAGPLDPEIGEAITSARGGGRPIDEGVRSDMEGHLGVDLSSVRIHADREGDRLSRSVQAEAFTTGTDVFFRAGRYQPSSTEGRRLLAHELTHVMQQSSGRASGSGEVSHPDDAHEVDARAIGDSVAASPPVQRAESEVEIEESADPDVQRQMGPEEEPEEEPEEGV